MSKRRILAIDGDIYAYQAAAAHEREVYFESWDTWTFAACQQAQRDSFIVLIDRLLKEFEGFDPVICYSSSENFRKAVYDKYKSKRTRKPLGYKALVEWSETQYQTKRIDGIEGDDVLGIMATKFPDVVMATIDKDLKTIPGVLWRGNGKGDYKIEETSEEEADRYFLYQTLTGDATDGYPGCPGIGPVSATRLLDKDCSWRAVVNAYLKAGSDYETALQQARCARILRASDWDFDNKKVILWTPTN